jgi:hypothetical protein
MMSLVLTSVPGHSVSFSLFIMPRTVTMPVVESTVFSTIATLPVSERRWPGIVAITLEAPAAMASRKSTSTRCGMAKVT